MRLTLDGVQRGRPIGEILVVAGLITPSDLELALEEQRAQPRRERLGTILVRQGRLTPGQLAWALSRQFRIIRRFGDGWTYPFPFPAGEGEPWPR